MLFYYTKAAEQLNQMLLCICHMLLCRVIECWSRSHSSPTHPTTLPQGDHMTFDDIPVSGKKFPRDRLPAFRKFSSLGTVALSCLVVNVNAGLSFNTRKGEQCLLRSKRSLVGRLELSLGSHYAKLLAAAC